MAYEKFSLLGEKFPQRREEFSGGKILTIPKNSHSKENILTIARQFSQQSRIKTLAVGEK